MELFSQLSTAFAAAVRTVYGWLWGDLVTLPLPGGASVGLSLLVLLLIPTGLYFTVRTRGLPVRLLPRMLRLTAERAQPPAASTAGGGPGRPSASTAISGVQALIVSTATRVGMGNLVGVVAALSLGGAGAVF